MRIDVKFHRAVAAVILVLISFSALADDANDVRDVFNAYRGAILAGQGEEASGLLSTNTYDYYDEMRTLALHGDKYAVQALSLVNQIQVLMFRLRVPTNELEALSPRGLLTYAIDHGWIGKAGVLKLAPGKVRTEGDIASLHLLVDEQDTGEVMHFNRENEAWRLDLMPTLHNTNMALQITAKRQGLSEREFLLILMESVIGRKIGEEAWRPPAILASP